MLLFKKRKEKPLVVSNEQELAGSVFSPRGTVRTFILAIDLQEMGDGKTKIVCRQLKEKDVE